MSFIAVEQTQKRNIYTIFVDALLNNGVIFYHLARLKATKTKGTVLTL
jgi:hypothetical protein